MCPCGIVHVGLSGDGFQLEPGAMEGASLEVTDENEYCHQDQGHREGHQDTDDLVRLTLGKLQVTHVVGQVTHDHLAQEIIHDIVKTEFKKLYIHILCSIAKTTLRIVLASLQTAYIRNLCIHASVGESKRIYCNAAI